MKILFDCDGTLMDSMHIWIDPIKQIENRYNFIPNQEQREFKESASFRGLCEYYSETFAHDMSADDIENELYEIIEDGYKNTIKPKNGVVEKIKQLHEQGYEMGIASSTDKYYLDIIFNRLGISDYFKFILTPDQTGLRKSDEKYWLKACELLVEKPENVVLFDDKIYAVRAAKKVGLKTVGVDDLPHNEEDIELLKKEADYYVDSVSEFDMKVFN